MIEPDSDSELAYVLGWKSITDRKTKWSAFRKDPQWLHVRNKSEKDGAIIANIGN